MEQFEQIRRDHARERLSIRELARRHGVHRRAVRQALESAVACALRRRVVWRAISAGCRRHLIPVPEVASIEELNELLQEACWQDLERTITGVGTRFSPEAGPASRTGRSWARIGNAEPHRVGGDVAGPAVLSVRTHG